MVSTRSQRRAREKELAVIDQEISPLVSPGTERFCGESTRSEHQSTEDAPSSSALEQQADSPPERGTARTRGTDAPRGSKSTRGKKDVGAKSGPKKAAGTKGSKRSGRGGKGGRRGGRKSSDGSADYKPTEKEQTKASKQNAGSESNKNEQPAEDDENASNNDKQPAENDETPSSVVATADTQPEAATDPCEYFTAKIAEARDRLAATLDPAAIEDPATVGHTLDDGMISRALASVIEAFAFDGPKFSLFHTAAMTQYLMQPDLNQQSSVLQVIRPGHEALIPRYTDNGTRSHISLYILRQVDGREDFDMVHYDSSKGRHHRSDFKQAGHAIRAALMKMQWDKTGTSSFGISDHVESARTEAKQRRHWECGLYVILFAWAYALGLNTDMFLDIPEERYSHFEAQAVELINLAIQGQANSRMIEAFLKCFGFTQQENIVPGDRHFDNTRPFMTFDDLNRHIASQQSREALNRLRLAGHLPNSRSGKPLTVQTLLEDLGRHVTWLEPIEELLAEHAGLLFNGSTATIAHETGEVSQAATNTAAEQNAISGGAQENQSQTSNASGSGRKRGHSDDGDENLAKRQKTEGQEDSVAAEPDQLLGPCDELSAGLSEVKAALRKDTLEKGYDSGPQVKFEAIYPELIAEITIHRAIASVTEAVSLIEPGVRAFSLVPPGALIAPKDYEGGQAHHAIARQACDILIPYTSREHTSLYHVHTDEQGDRYIYHYDSGEAGHDEENETQVQHILSILKERKWLLDEEMPAPIDQTSPRRNQTRQRHYREAGLHTILHAWAIALGFEVIGNGINPRCDELWEQGVELVNFAIQGRIGSALIVAFLKCFGLISPDAAMLPGRSFANTFQLTDIGSLELRIARLNMELYLNEMQAHEPDARIFSVDEILENLERDENALLHNTPEEIWRSFTETGLGLSPIRDVNAAVGSPAPATAITAPEVGTTQVGNDGEAGFTGQDTNANASQDDQTIGEAPSSNGNTHPAAGSAHSPIDEAAENLFNRVNSSQDSGDAPVPDAFDISPSTSPVPNTTEQAAVQSDEDGVSTSPDTDTSFEIYVDTGSTPSPEQGVPADTTPGGTSVYVYGGSPPSREYGDENQTPPPPSQQDSSSPLIVTPGQLDDPFGPSLAAPSLLSPAVQTPVQESTDIAQHDVDDEGDQDSPRQAATNNDLGLGGGTNVSPPQATAGYDAAASPAVEPTNTTSYANSLFGDDNPDQEEAEQHATAAPETRPEALQLNTNSTSPLSPNSRLALPPPTPLNTASPSLGAANAHTNIAPVAAPSVAPNVAPNATANAGPPHPNMGMPGLFAGHFGLPHAPMVGNNRDHEEDHGGYQELDDEDEPVEDEEDYGEPPETDSEGENEYSDQEEDYDENEG